MTWDDLKSIRKALHQAAADAAAARRQRAMAEPSGAVHDKQLFARTVGPVVPLKPTLRAEPTRPLAAPEPRQRQLDEQAALHEALSDQVDVESLLLTDDGLGFRRPDVPAEVLGRLRKGHWAIQRQLDLHGLRRDEAREALADFIHQAHQHSQRCVRVIHGKGHGSPGKQPVLKSKVQRWLAQRQEVMAFAQASAPQGGAGALIVLLNSRTSR
jgi:DNA-nicking Smr family endonuclease